VCINSLEKKIDPKIHYDIVLIDEAESLLKHICEHSLKSNYFSLVSIIKKSSKTILLDYGLGNMSMQLVKDSQMFTPEKTLFLYNTYKNKDKKVTFVDEQVLNSMIVENAQNNKKIFVGCDTKTQVEVLREFLVNNGVDREEILVIHSDEKNKDKIKDKNYPRIIIVSPSVTYGVNIDLEYDFIFGYYENKTIDYKEQFQQISRIRKCNNIFIFSKEVHKKIPKNVFTRKGLVKHLNEKLKKCQEKYRFQYNVKKELYEQFELQDNNIIFENGVPVINERDSFTQLQISSSL